MRNTTIIGFKVAFFCFMVSGTGCALFESTAGGVAPAMVGLTEGARAFGENVGTGTPYELIYAAIAGITTTVIGTVAAYRKGKKNGQNGKPTI